MKHIKLFEELADINRKVIDEAYDDYINETNPKFKYGMARQIKRMAKGFVMNRDSTLSDWIDKFKDEELVMNELEQLILDEEMRKYNL